MSRFADPTATRTVQLGPCECPGAPHEQDEAEVRSDLSAVEIGRLQMADQTDADAMVEAYLPFIVSWNLRDEKGAVELNSRSFMALDDPTLSKLAGGVAESIAASMKLPNASGAPSPASSRGSASQARRKTRTPGT